MNLIVDEILPKLIDVCRNVPHPYSQKSKINRSNDTENSTKQRIEKSLVANSSTNFPDAGFTNLPSLMSDRALSSNLCHYLAYSTNELSRFFIDEIKIIHKEELVVIFE